MDKPPAGCAPYYVRVHERICELCKAIMRHAGRADGHKNIRLWTTEIMFLTELDRCMRKQEKMEIFDEEDTHGIPL